MGTASNPWPNGSRLPCNTSRDAENSGWHSSSPPNHTSTSRPSSWVRNCPVAIEGRSSNQKPGGRARPLACQPTEQRSTERRTRSF